MGGAKKTTSSEYTASDPSTIDHIGYTEHAIELRILPDVSLIPVANFGLFSNDSMIIKLVQVANTYVKEKRTSSWQWSHPTTVPEFQIYLGMTILKVVTRLEKVSRCWSYHIDSAKSSRSFNYYGEIK